LKKITYKAYVSLESRIKSAIGGIISYPHQAFRKLWVWIGDEMFKLV